MKKKILIVLILSISILTSSCASITGDTDTIDDNKVYDEDNSIVEEVPINTNIYKDEVVLGMKRPKTLNPLLSNDVSVTTVLKLIYLDIVSLSDNNLLQYNLIDTYTFDQETKTGVITIRDNIMWQGDNGYVSADDFIYSLNVLSKAPDDAVYKSSFSNILSYNKIDDKTISFALKNSMAGLPYFLNFPVIPKNFFENFISTDGVHFDPLIGNGLYINTKNTINGDMLLADNPNDDVSVMIDSVRIEYIEDIEGMLNSFEQNKIDLVVENIQLWNKYHIDKDVNITEFNNMELELMGFNFTKEYINDINFRRAINLSIPTEQIINTIYLGFCDFSNTVLPSNHFAYYSEIALTKQNIENARNMLKISKYSGEQVEILISNKTVQDEKVGELIVNNLRDIGINANYTLADSDEHLERLSNGEFDIFIGTFNMSTLPDFTNLFGNNNILGYNNVYINELITNSLNANSVDEYKIILREIQKSVNEGLPIISLFHKSKAIISSSKILTTKPSSYNNPYGNFDRFVNQRK